MPDPHYLSEDAFRRIRSILDQHPDDECTPAEYDEMDAILGDLKCPVGVVCLGLALMRRAALGRGDGALVEDVSVEMTDAVTWMSYIDGLQRWRPTGKKPIAHAFVDEGYLLYLVLSGMAGRVVPVDVEHLIRVRMDPDYDDLMRRINLSCIDTYYDCLNSRDTLLAMSRG